MILSTFSLKPSSESPARASHKSSSQGPWSACSRSCGGGIQWRAKLNGTRYLCLRHIRQEYFTLTSYFNKYSSISDQSQGVEGVRVSSLPRNVKPQVALHIRVARLGGQTVRPAQAWLPIWPVAQLRQVTSDVVIIINDGTRDCPILSW